MRVVTAPDGSLIDLSDWYLTYGGIGILIEDSPDWTPVPEGEIGTGSYVYAYPGGYIGYVVNVSTFGEVTGTSSDRIAYRVCVPAWEPDCRWLGETNVELYAEMTPEPTRTSMPTPRPLTDTRVIASVCENGRVVYPARMEVRYAGVVELDLVNDLYGPMEGYYQVCPTGHRNYTQCWDVPAVNVELRRVDCTTPTPVPEMQTDQCTDPDGLCVGSRWLKTHESGNRYIVILNSIGVADGVTYYQADIYAKTRDEFLEEFTLWETE
jgi:hypothetical protein